MARVTGFATGMKPVYRAPLDSVATTEVSKNRISGRYSPSIGRKLDKTRLQSRSDWSVLTVKVVARRKRAKRRA